MTEHEQILGELTYRLFFDESYAERFKLLGIDAADWPEDSDCRSLVEQYFAFKRTAGHRYAQNKLGMRVSSLERKSLPHDDPGLKYEYDRVNRDYFFYRMAMEILKDQKSAERCATRILEFTTRNIVAREFDETIESIANTFNEKVKGGGALIKIPGWEILSDEIGGFNSGRLIMILADTGFGKTTLALNLAINAKQLSPLIYFNMEMIDEDFAIRTLVARNKIEYAKPYKDGFDAFEHKQMGPGFIVTDGSDLSLDQIISLIRKYKKSLDIKFAFVDYDQKIIFPYERGMEEWRQIHAAMVRLEAVAKELGVCVIALAQTNKEGQISSSRRATFPASTVLSFYQDENGVFIEAVKNRFGKRNIKLKVGYDTKRASVVEQGIYQKQEKSLMNDK